MSSGKRDFYQVLGVPKGSDKATIKKARARDLPIFGVCLGLQSMGQCFGGKVIRAPAQMHGKTSKIHHTGKGVFEGLPSPFIATRYHSLIVTDIPDCLEVNARSDDTHVMGFRHTSLPIHGVQFHPESIASENGHAILKNFLDIAHDFNLRKAA